MAADEKALGDLHTKVAETLSKLLDGTPVPGYVDEDSGEEQEATTIPPSAAVITASIQFLKNNNITCTPAKDNALGELEQKMKERQARRTASRTDLAAATEQTGFLTGLPH